MFLTLSMRSDPLAVSFPVLALCRSGDIVKSAAISISCPIDTQRSDTDFRNFIEDIAMDVGDDIIVMNSHIPSLTQVGTETDCDPTWLIVGPIFVHLPLDDGITPDEDARFGASMDCALILPVTIRSPDRVYAPLEQTGCPPPPPPPPPPVALGTMIPPPPPVALGRTIPPPPPPLVVACGHVCPGATAAQGSALYSFLLAGFALSSQRNFLAVLYTGSVEE